jgi:pimeloyl-ACP methyl ester carboxylesterase
MDDRFRGIEFPVLFSHGEHDAIIPVAAARHGHAITPGSTLSVYETSGHSPFMEQAERFNGELRDFVLRCNR